MTPKKLNYKIVAAYIGCKASYGKYVGKVVALDKQHMALRLKDGTTKGVPINRSTLMLKPVTAIFKNDADMGYIQLELGLSKNLINSFQDDHYAYQLKIGNAIEVIDWLRRRHYDCGFEGIASLIKAGLAGYAI